MEILRRNSQIAIVSKFEEEQGILLMKHRIKGYLRVHRSDNDSDRDVRFFLEESLQNDQLLLDYLQGRKYKVDVAWETLRQYAENRFIVYPDVFGQVTYQNIVHLLEKHVVGVLKHRDKFGRLITYFDFTKWDTSQYTIDDFTCMAVFGVERLWRRPEVLQKGVIIVESLKGFGLTEARRHSYYTTMRFRSIFLHSYPVSMQGLFQLNVTFASKVIFRLFKSLLPKKITERMHLYSGGEEPVALYEIAPPEILPTWLGGKLSIEEASEDLSFYETFS